MRLKRLAIITFYALLCAMIFTLACISPAQEQIAKGDNYYKQRQWDETITAYNKAIELDPKLKDELNPKLTIAYTKRGYAYNVNSDYVKAIGDSTLAIKLDPKYADAYFVRAWAHYGNSEYYNARDDEKKMIELDPKLNLNELKTKLALSYNVLGLADTSKGDYDNTIANCTRAIELDPKLAEAYYNRGFARYKETNYEKAIDDYTTVIELNPKDAKAYHRRGNAYMKDAKHYKAIDDFNKAIELDPKLAQAYNSRGHYYLSRRDFNPAIADFTKAIEIDPNYAAPYAGRFMSCGRGHISCNGSDFIIANRYVAQFGSLPWDTEPKP